MRKRKAARRRSAKATELTLFSADGEPIHVSPAPVTESLRYMVARARLNDNQLLADQLGLTSAMSGEGVTTVCRSLALVLSNDSARSVCLVDVNWWSPSNWPSDTDLIARGGIAAVLRGSLPLQEALVPTGNVGLEFLPAGAVEPAERPLLANSSEFAKVLVELSERFDHVILDLPAVHTTSESLVLVESARTVALVVAQGATPEEQVKSALAELSGADVRGVILNRAKTKVPGVLLRRVSGL